MNYILLILSVIVGAIIVLFIKPNSKIVRLLLAFSGAYLLSVTVMHLLPEIYDQSNHQGHHHGENHTKICGILILLGVLLQSILESFSKGLEHGHIHLNEKDKHKFPWMLFVSLCIHALSEGLPIHGTDNNLLWAVIVHKVPIAIVLTTLLLHSSLSKTKIIVAISTFAFMTPIGHYLGSNLSFIAENHALLNAFIVGVFIHISTVILFESNENHKFNLGKFSAIVIGILLAIMTL